MVLDASVVSKWFKREDEQRLTEARRLRTEFEEQRLGLVAPSILPLELLNAAGRRWGWKPDALFDMAASLERLQLRLFQPELSRVANCMTFGLTAYDASYVALAEQLGLRLVTEDRAILDVAPRIAIALVDV